MVGVVHIHKQKFVERRFIKRLSKDVGELPSEKLAICEELNSKYSPLSMRAGEFLYELAYHSNDKQEIETNLLQFIDNKCKIPYTCNSKDCMMFKYGKVYGSQKYEDTKIRLAAQVKEQIKQGKSKIGSEMSILAKEAVKQLVEADPLYHRKKNKTCIEYYHSRGIYDPAIIEQSISAAISTLPRNTKESFTPERWEEIVEARKKGLRDRGIVGYSKEANKFFEKIIDTGVLKNLDYWYSKTHRGEFWVRDIADNNKYYFVDFCIPELKIAIEYHGHRYHPKSIDDLEYEKHRFSSMLPLEEKWQYDEQKRKSIKDRGFYYIEVWSDNLPDIHEFCDMLKEIIHERHKSLFAV